MAHMIEYYKNGKYYVSLNERSKATKFFWKEWGNRRTWIDAQWVVYADTVRSGNGWSRILEAELPKNLQPEIKKSKGIRLAELF